MTIMDHVPAGELTTEQIAHYLACRRARDQIDGPTRAEIERHLADQARACRIAAAMIVEDGFPAELTEAALIEVYPRHAAVITATVREVVAELP